MEYNLEAVDAAINAVNEALASGDKDSVGVDRPANGRVGDLDVPPFPGRAACHRWGVDRNLPLNARPPGWCKRMAVTYKICIACGYLW